MFRRSSIRKLASNIVGVSLYIIYEVCVLVSMGSPARWWEFTVFYILDISLFYSNCLLVFPMAFSGKNWLLRLIPMLAIQLFVYSLLTFSLDIFVNAVKHNIQLIDIRQKDMLRAIWRYVLIVGFSSTFWSVIRYIARLKREAMLKEAYQHARLNAHLLFNTLNFIYNSVESISIKASEAIMLLSDVMRYALAEVNEHGTIELKHEVKQVENYIRLHHIRYNNKLYIDVNISPDAMHSELPIPPLLLMTFLENIFKHGNLGIKEYPALISISCTEQILHVHTENTKRHGKIIPFSHHMGLASARTRLQNRYGKDYDLVLEDNERIFILDLKVRL